MYVYCKYIICMYIIFMYINIRFIEIKIYWKPFLLTYLFERLIFLVFFFYTFYSQFHKIWKTARALFDGTIAIWYYVSYSAFKIILIYLMRFCQLFIPNGEISQRSYKIKTF